MLHDMFTLDTIVYLFSSQNDCAQNQDTFCILMLYVLFIELHEKIDFLIDNIFVALALQSLSKGANYPVLLDNK
jgi:hypothetical protein